MAGFEGEGASGAENRFLGDGLQANQDNRVHADRRIRCSPVRGAAYETYGLGLSCGTGCLVI